MKFLILLFIIVCNLQYLAHSQEFKLKHKIIKPSLCLNNKGEKVYFQNLDTKTIRFTAGVAKRNITGKPTIYRFNYQKAPKSLQMFIDFHECAHHQTGDLEKSPPPQSSPEHMMKESIADCIAAIRIKSDIIDGETIIQEALEELKIAMNEIGFPKSSIESRELNIKECFKKDVKVMYYVNSVIKKRNLKKKDSN